MPRYRKVYKDNKSDETDINVHIPAWLDRELNEWVANIRSDPEIGLRHKRFSKSVLCRIIIENSVRKKLWDEAMTRRLHEIDQEDDADGFEEVD